MVALQSCNRSLERSLLLSECAYYSAEQFYQYADDIMSDPATPDALHDMIYSMTEMLSDDKASKKVYAAMKDAFSQKATVPKDTELYREFKQLGRHRIDLYEKIGGAVVSWMLSISAVHGPADMKVSKTVAGQANRPVAFGAAEKLVSWINRGDNGGNLHLTA